MSARRVAGSPEQNCGECRNFNILQRQVDDNKKTSEDRVANLERKYEALKEESSAVIRGLTKIEVAFEINMKSINDKLADLSIKVASLELSPGKNWSIITKTVITGIVGAVVGAAMFFILKQ